MKNQSYDVLIIGAGGSGLCAAILAAKKGMRVAVVSKVHPMQSHTVAAQGGINAALGNVSEDDISWHIYDTLKASDWIADEDSVELMCKKAPEIIDMLDQLGVDFSRNAKGKIDQKIYGGQSTNFGKGELAKRACYSKDKTGQTVMDRLYAEASNDGIEFYNFFFALDLIIDNGNCCGVTCIDIENGEVRSILATNTIIATGGYSQIYHNVTSASICTGDGIGLVARCGLPLQDMEFVQFHPTALHGVGVLITEAARSVGARLLNGNGERFMSRYAPKFMELAPRDVVSRAIAAEIVQGRGAGDNKDHVYLDLTQHSADYIKEHLPTIFENCMSFYGVDPSKNLIAVSPASHYTMGGIPTDNSCRVVADQEDTVACVGLYAIGEAASISVHGANRLGCNSLLDLLVFASVAVDDIASSADHFGEINLDKIEDYTKERLYFILKEGGCKKALFSVAELTERLKIVMSKNVQLFRNTTILQNTITEIQNIKREYAKIKIPGDLSWNIELIKYIELGNLIIAAEATTRASLWRTESRGCHYRSDYPASEKSMRVHSLIWIHNNEIVKKSVRISESLRNNPDISSDNVYFFQEEQRNY